MTAPTICPATRRDGQPCRCRNNLNAETGFCPMHDPERREAWQASRRRAASVTNAQRYIAPPGPPRTLQDAAEFAAWATWAAVTGRLSATAVKAVRAALAEFRQLRGAVEHAERLVRLEAEVSRLRKERRA